MPSFFLVCSFYQNHIAPVSPPAYGCSLLPCSCKGQLIKKQEFCVLPPVFDQNGSGSWDFLWTLFSLLSCGLGMFSALLSHVPPLFQCRRGCAIRFGAALMTAKQSARLRWLDSFALALHSHIKTLVETHCALDHGSCFICACPTHVVVMGRFLNINVARWGTRAEPFPILSHQEVAKLLFCFVREPRSTIWSQS